MRSMNSGITDRVANRLSLAGLLLACLLMETSESAEPDPVAGSLGKEPLSAQQLPDSFDAMTLREETVSPKEDPPPRYRPDFGGSWEKDFARSDRWEDELSRQLDQLRRDAERGYQLETRRVPSTTIAGRSRTRNGANIIELAQLTGYINRQTIMRIQQTAMEVRIERKDDADLVCSTQDEVTYAWKNAAGEEVCGWDGNQLVFSITLPEGVQILHRFSLSGDGNWLNMATTTSSSAATFTQVQFFYRYIAPDEDYTCIQTISRGNTCSLRDSVQYD